MSLRRILIAGLVIAAGVPAPAASARFMDNPGPAAQNPDSAMQMRVARDQNAPDPPRVIAQTHAPANRSDNGLPWVDIAIPAALVGLFVAGAAADRRRRTAADGVSY
jgi:hypothetical protein